jgi:hypothetical protein
MSTPATTTAPATTSSGWRVPGNRTATASAVGIGLIDWAVTVAAALPWS